MNTVTTYSTRIIGLFLFLWPVFKHGIDCLIGKGHIIIFFFTVMWPIIACVFYQES